MKIRGLAFVIIALITSACSPLAVTTAEVTGLSLLHERRESSRILLDEKVELNASLKLNLNNPIRNQCHWNVTAYNGRVLITGEAPTQPLRQQIVNIVQALEGVTAVYNELRVAPISTYMNRSVDALISSQVKSALSYIKKLPGFDATRVKIVTENRVVYLLGLVHSNEGQVATEVARREKDVTKVVKLFEYIDQQTQTQ